MTRSVLLAPPLFLQPQKKVLAHQAHLILAALVYHFMFQTPAHARRGHDETSGAQSSHAPHSMGALTSAALSFGLGVSFGETLAAMGYSADDLKRSGFTAKEIVTAAPSGTFDATTLVGAGYTEAELKEAGFLAQQLRAAGCSAHALRQASYTAAELHHGAGFDAISLVSAGFSASELVAAGLNATALRLASVPADALKRAGCSACELHEAGFDAAAVVSAGYPVAQLNHAGYSAHQLKSAGCSAASLQAAGFSAGQMREQPGFKPLFTAGVMRRAGEGLLALCRSVQDARLAVTLVCRLHRCCAEGRRRLL